MSTALRNNHALLQMWAILLSIFLLMILQSKAAKYIIVAQDGNFIQPCKENDSRIASNDEFLSLNLTHVELDDMETILTSGEITILSDAALEGPIQLTVDVFKWRRGSWEVMPFSIKRTDLCLTVFKPSEPWYSVAKEMPEEEQVCPPHKGSVYHLHNISNRIEMPYTNTMPDLSGTFKIHILKHHVITEQLGNGVEVYVCIICQTKFETKSEFKIHMKLHTTTTENIEFITDEPAESGPYKASGTHSTQASLLMTSIEGENLDAAIMNVSASSAAEPGRAKKFQCRKCYKCFALKRSLIRHMRMHYTTSDADLTAECSDCDVQFSCAEDYQEHLAEQHQVVCSQCPDLIFKSIQDLKSHMSQHGTEQ